MVLVQAPVGGVARAGGTALFAWRLSGRESVTAAGLLLLTALLLLLIRRTRPFFRVR